MYMVGNYAYPALGLSDVDGDGVKEVLVPHQDGLLRCHDGLTGKVEWTFPIGTRPTGILAWDANGDGRDEFVFGTQGGWIYALQGDSKPLWTWEAPRDWGGRVDWLIAADLLGTGCPQLVVSANGHVYLLER
jgi:outer membrane protein assembly factor BamB